MDDFSTEVKRLTPEETYCETYFQQTQQKASDGKFIVRVPYSGDVSELGESHDVAMRRFLSKRLARAFVVQKSYVDFMKEYEQLGHMKDVESKHVPKQYYFIPHHCVVKAENTTTKRQVENR